MKKALVSYSAGIDSTTLAFLLREKGYDVTLATFKDGPANDYSLEEDYCNYNEVMDLDSFSKELVWYQNWLSLNFNFKKVIFDFPSLNLFSPIKSYPGIKETQLAEVNGCKFWVGYKSIMCLMLLSYGAAKNYDIVATGHMPYNNHYVDESLESYNYLSTYMNFAYADRVTIPKLIHPFYEKELNSKEKVLIEAYRLGVPLHYTFSCMINTIRLSCGRWAHCGKCENCLERARGFSAINKIDPAL